MNANSSRKSNKPAASADKSSKSKPSKSKPVVAAAETAPAKPVPHAVTVHAAAKRDALRESAGNITAQIDANAYTDADALAKARLLVCNAESRAVRSNKIVAMSDADAATFGLFVKMHDTEAKLNAFFARAIYVQDKLRQIISAIARGLALGNVTRNRSTATVVRELLKSAQSRKSLLAAIVRDCDMTANTASSQVSSSIIALTHVGIIAADPVTKEYRITDNATAELLAA